jgi:hypothetical protein
MGRQWTALCQLDRLLFKQLGPAAEQEITRRILSRAGVYMVGVLFWFPAPAGGWVRVKLEDGSVLGAMPIAHRHRFVRAMVQVEKPGRIALEYWTETPGRAPRIIAVGLQRIAELPHHLSTLAIPPTSVCAAVAGHPSRHEMLRATFDSLLPQVDYLFAYLSGYAYVPDFLLDASYGHKIHFILDASSEYRASSRFSWISRYRCYWLICEDGIVYPPDYRERMLSVLSAYGDNAVIGVEGDSVARQRSCDEEAAPVVRVDMLACSSLCFNSRLLDGPREVRLLKSAVRPDEALAHICRERGVPQLCIAREAAGLRSQAWRKRGVRKDAALDVSGLGDPRTALGGELA